MVQHGPVTNTEHFYLVEDGHGRWVIRHQITDILAGTILRTAGGFRLKNENSRTVGNFESIELALEGLYAVV
ncbi:hypothetical protein BH09ACT5_BH09ACT5_10210 [soil metagenome]